MGCNMFVKLVKMRRNGIEINRRALSESYANPGALVVMDVTDQGLRRPVKVARLMEAGTIRFELTDVHIVWINDGRMTLSGFERQRNEAGEVVDYAQSWLCVLTDEKKDE